MADARRESEIGSAERWTERYRRSDCVFGRRAASVLRHHSELLGTNGEALDMAMGEGRNAIFLAERGFRVTGVDISLLAVRRAWRLAAERGVEIRTVVADLGDFPLHYDRWSLIVDIRFLDRALLARVERLLRPGGIFVLEHFSVDHPAIADFGPTDPSRLLQHGELFTLLSGLRILHYEDGVFEDDSRRAALVRLIARRPD